MKKSLFKRFVTLMLVVLMIASLSVEAFAVTYPTVSYVSRTASTIRRGRAITYRFYLKSGNVHAVSPYNYRAKATFDLYKPSGSRIGGLTKKYDYNTYYNVTYTSGRYDQIGTYRLYVNTYFTKSYYGSANTWYWNRYTTNNAYVTFKVKA